MDPASDVGGVSTRKGGACVPNESGVPPKRLKIVNIACETYGMVLDPGLRGTGPSGHVQMSDILSLLLEHTRRMVAECVIHDGTTTLWKYTERNDLSSLGMELKEEVVVMKHQSDTLRKVNNGGYTRSCNVKMPCAAGKTLLALLHICELQTFAIIFTNCSMASRHWFDQAHQFFNLPESGVVILHSDNDGNPTVSLKTLVYKRPSIVICTYQMMTSTQKHNDSLTEVIQYVKKIPWGIKILDEAQTAPASSYKDVLEIQSFTTMTVSASYKREDDQMKRLFKEVSGLIITVEKEDLIARQLLPRVNRIEVHTDPFQVQQQQNLGHHKRQHLAIMNPKKVSMCLSLINYHANLNDNIIIFCDDLQAVELLFTTFSQFEFETDVHFCGRITMNTPLEQRLETLSAFRGSSGGSVLLMSRVGDVAIDLPGANVLIQMSCISKSKNQEIQRTGRIQRRSSRQVVQHTSYCLITTGSDEAENVVHRRNYMTKEGYVTTIVTASETTDSRYDDTSHAKFAHSIFVTCNAIN